MAVKDISVGQVAELLSGSRKAGKKTCLLVGAGVSKTAGIGLASDFVARIKRDYRKNYDATCAETGTLEPGYAQCMAALPPATQVQLVRDDIKNSKINWAHIGIARLERDEVADTILTPNFDPLVSRACALFHRFPAIYDLAGLRDDRADHIDFDRSFVEGSAIFHLHGQHTGFVLLNTAEKLLVQAKRIRPVLDATMKGKPVVIAGYSGANDPLIEEIAQLAPFNHGLFWVAFDGNDPAPNVCEHLLTLPNCKIVRNQPSDQFFTELANAMKLDPPIFMVSPFKHMLGVLGTIGPFAEDGSSAQDELLARARRQLDRAGDAATESTGAAREIATLMAAADYGAVLDRFGHRMEDLDEDARDQVAWAAIEIGWACAKQALDASGEAADALFEQAAEKYAAALAIKPHKYEALNNWGIALLDQAKMKQGKAAEALLAQAEEKFDAALATKPIRYEALSNWGNALTDRAKMMGGEAADALFEQAAQKYAAALAIKPDTHDALFNWGVALFEQAKMKQGAAAVALLEQAAEKYAAALAIKPDMYDALYNWGGALLYGAKMKRGEGAEALLAQAEEKFAAALAIKPDKYDALSNWGNALTDRAKMAEGGAADALFEQAAQKYAAALAIKPDMHDALYNWGVALFHQAKMKQEAAAVALLEQAVGKYAAALAINPRKHEALNSWGSALLGLAQMHRGEAVEPLLKQAEEKLEQAEELLPGSGSYNLACARAIRGDSAAASTWLRRSKEQSPDFPGCEHLLRDPDFDGIRHSADFLSALKDIGCVPSA
ncbi:MAG TPA: SIR2 family protein [Allosphingosinicella sp.]|jgi:tetratricopeptide (TPR) repeat protein